MSIDQNWAFHLIRMAISNAKEKEWSYEQMNDVIHSVLAQRPELKNAAIKQLRVAGYNRHSDIQRFQNLLPSQRTQMPKFAFVNC